MSTNKERLIAALQEPLETTLTRYKTHLDGLKEDQVEENRDLYGENVITKGQEDSIIKKIYESIINPFTVILLVIALVSFITNVWLAKPGEEDPTTSIIIVTLVLTTLPPGEREARSIEDLQTRLARIGRQIAFALDSTASRAEHSLTHERPRFSFFQMLSPRGGGRREAPKFEQVAPGVAKHEQEIVLAPGVEPEPDRYLPLRVAAAAAEFELPISPVTLQNLRRCPIRDSVWDDESRQLFVRLLASGPALMRVWEELDFVDIPGRWMPEWLGIRNRPSASAAHRYTIDRHSVEVTSRLARVSAARGERYDDRHYTALLLAGLLHDVGKRPFVTDHAAEGARHAAVIMKRMGFDADIARWVRILVREHLTLSEFATGKNPNDPAVGESLARCVDRDPMLLDMLYDLTRADGSSLGATAGEEISKRYGWSHWRESLVRAMYSAARESIRVQVEGGYADVDFG